MGRLRRYWMELALAVAGLLCLSHSARAWWRYQAFQTQHATWQPAPRTPSDITSARHSGDPIGHIAIKRLGFSSVLVEGSDENALGLGVGHVPNTAPVGGSGNVVLAGHRDTSFWPLRNLKEGDRIDVTTDKRYVYRVLSLTIVDPSEVALLRPTRQPALTLVTCYPFRHVGPAPKRLLIRAAPVSDQHS